MGYQDHKAYIEFTRESGEVVLTQRFSHENIAQEEFNKLELIRSPRTYQGLTLNLSEYPEGRIGSVRLVVEFDGERYERRELYRRP